MLLALFCMCTLVLASTTGAATTDTATKWAFFHDWHWLSLLLENTRDQFLAEDITGISTIRTSKP